MTMAILPGTTSITSSSSVTHDDSNNSNDHEQYLLTLSNVHLNGNSAAGCLRVGDTVVVFEQPTSSSSKNEGQQQQANKSHNEKSPQESNNEEESEETPPSLTATTLTMGSTCTVHTTNNSTTWIWPIQAVQENVTLKPVESTVLLKLINDKTKAVIDDDKLKEKGDIQCYTRGTVSFQISTLAECAKFRNLIVEKIRSNKQQVNSSLSSSSAVTGNSNHHQGDNSKNNVSETDLNSPIVKEEMEQNLVKKKAPVPGSSQSSAPLQAEADSVSENVNAMSLPLTSSKNPPSLNSHPPVPKQVNYMTPSPGPPSHRHGHSRKQGHHRETSRESDNSMSIATADEGPVISHEYPNMPTEETRGNNGDNVKDHRDFPGHDTGSSVLSGGPLHHPQHHYDAYHHIQRPDTGHAPASEPLPRDLQDHARNLPHSFGSVPPYGQQPYPPYGQPQQQPQQAPPHHTPSPYSHYYPPPPPNPQQTQPQHQTPQQPQYQMPQHPQYYATQPSNPPNFPPPYGVPPPQQPQYPMQQAYPFYPPPPSQHLPYPPPSQQPYPYPQPFPPPYPYPQQPYTSYPYAYAHGSPYMYPPYYPPPPHAGKEKSKKSSKKNKRKKNDKDNKDKEPSGSIKSSHSHRNSPSVPRRNYSFQSQSSNNIPPWSYYPPFVTNIEKAASSSSDSTSSNSTSSNDSPDSSDSSSSESFTSNHVKVSEDKKQPSKVKPSKVKPISPLEISGTKSEKSRDRKDKRANIEERTSSLRSSSSTIPSLLDMPSSKQGKSNGKRAKSADRYRLGKQYSLSSSNICSSNTDLKLEESEKSGGLGSEAEQEPASIAKNLSEERRGLRKGQSLRTVTTNPTGFTKKTRPLSPAPTTSPPSSPHLEPKELAAASNPASRIPSRRQMNRAKSQPLLLAMRKNSTKNDPSKPKNDNNSLEPVTDAVVSRPSLGNKNRHSRSAALKKINNENENGKSEMAKSLSEPRMNRLTSVRKELANFKSQSSQRNFSWDDKVMEDKDDEVARPVDSKRRYRSAAPATKPGVQHVSNFSKSSSDPSLSRLGAAGCAAAVAYAKIDIDSESSNSSSESDSESSIDVSEIMNELEPKKPKANGGLRRTMSKSLSERRLPAPSLVNQELNLFGSRRNLRVLDTKVSAKKKETENDGIVSAQPPTRPSDGKSLYRARMKATRPGVQFVKDDSPTREEMKREASMRSVTSYGSRSQTSSREVDSRSFRGIAQRKHSIRDYDSEQKPLSAGKLVMDDDFSHDTRSSGPTVTGSIVSKGSENHSNDSKIRPEIRAAIPGAQQVSHDMVRQEFVTLGSKYNPRSDEQDEEESKQEISDGASVSVDWNTAKALPVDLEAKGNVKSALSKDEDLAKKKQATYAAVPGTAAFEEERITKKDDLEKAGSFETPSKEAYIGGNLALGDVSESKLIEATIVDDESVAGSVVAAVAVDPEKEQRRKRILFCWVTVGCGCLALMVSLIVVFTVPNGSDSGPPPITTEERYAMFEDIVQNLVYDTSTLEDPISPQSQALDWIAVIDTMYMDPSKVPPGKLEKLHQRYYLALFYFTMTQNDVQWQYCNQAETGESNACVHHAHDSVGVEGVYFPQHEREPTFRWLSIGIDECRWAGLGCEDGFDLSHIQLGMYELRGTLPVELAYLRKLRLLGLDMNELYGTIPGQWGALAVNGSRLESLRLDANSFTGEIPEQWCNFNSTTMNEMILAKNGLTGTLPSCLSKITSMEKFSVKDNQLTGTIPPELGDWTNLLKVHFAGNSFEGKVAKDICVLHDEGVLFETSADCKNILSENYVQCSCCTKCCDGGEDTCELQYDLPEGTDSNIMSQTTGTEEAQTGDQHHGH